MVATWISYVFRCCRKPHSDFIWSRVDIFFFISYFHSVFTKICKNLQMVPKQLGY